MTKAKKSKAVYDFLPLPADGFVSRLTAIHDKMFGNTALPNPPVELAVFQVRAFGRLGYTDWSQPVQRMVI